MICHKPVSYTHLDVYKRQAYSKVRKAFGTEIMNHQIIQFKLADMATKIEASRLLCLKACLLYTSRCV